jgi:hypothetical protein
MSEHHQEREQLLAELQHNPAGIAFSIRAGENYLKLQAARALEEQGVVIVDQSGSALFVWMK